MFNNNERKLAGYRRIFRGRVGQGANASGVIFVWTALIGQFIFILQFNLLLLY